MSDSLDLREYQAASVEDRCAMIRESYAARDTERAAERAQPYGDFVVPGFGGRGEGVQSALRYWNVAW